MGRGLAGLIFFDTSAAIALADPNDDFHDASISAFDNVLADDESLLTHNYVIVETVTLLQSRLGLAVAEEFQRTTQSSLQLHWITEADHHLAVERWRRRNTRRLNLVDCMSFVVMEMYGCETAFTYDSDFETEGFRSVG